MMRTGLCLNTGGNTVTREQLCEVKTPQRTETWVPIPHLTVLNQVEMVLKESGYTITDEAHGLARDGQRYFGLIEVANGHNAKDFSLMIGLRNSHDRSFPVGFGLGGRVFVCDNLSFIAQVMLARKHTANVERDLPALTMRAISKLVSLKTTQEDRFLAYKQSEFTDKHAHDFIVRAFRAGVLPVTKLPAILEQWHAPNHPEFKEKTGWRLFNGITEALKGNLVELPRRTQMVHGLLDAELGLVFPNGPEVVKDITADATIEVAQPQAV